MAQITTKELSALSDLLTMEKTLTAKYWQSATDVTDPAIKEHYVQMAMRHQTHYDELLSNLK